MHVVLLNLAYRADCEHPEDLLARYHPLTGWADAVAGALGDEDNGSGRVTIIQRFCRSSTVARGGVTCRFVDDDLAPLPSWWQVPTPALELAARMCSDAAAQHLHAVVHLQGLGFGALVPRLRRLLPPGTAVVVQHHAELPSGGIAGLLQRRGLRAADAFLFAARGLANEWIVRGAIPADRPLFEVMEGSIDFEVDDRAGARGRTGIAGSPVLLWVGRLDDNKDPFTVLTGLEPVLAERPEARLFMVHGPDSPRLPEVERRIASSEVLARAVTILGTVPYERMPAIFNSSDYFILGSRHEGGGFSLVEALACGVVPVVTDIPSFRRMTAGGEVGALWPPGRSDSLTEALRRVLDRPLASQTAAARRVFERVLSWPVIGREAVAAYRTAISAAAEGRRSRLQRL
jgi:glycosyltransferase involved in cell wall biosynthesis